MIVPSSLVVEGKAAACRIEESEGLDMSGLTLVEGGGVGGVAGALTGGQVGSFLIFLVESGFQVFSAERWRIFVIPHQLSSTCSPYSCSPPGS